MGLAKQFFSKADQIVRGSTLYKVGEHASMSGIAMPFLFYVFGVKTVEQKVQERASELDHEYTSSLQELNARKRIITDKLATERLERKKLSKKTADGFKQLNTRVSVVEFEANKKAAAKG